MVNKVTEDDRPTWIRPWCS